MKIDEQITNVRVVYDDKTKKCLEAYALVDGVPTSFEHDSDIRNLLANLKLQKGVKRLSELDSSDYQIAFTKDKDKVAVFRTDFDEKANAYYAEENQNEFTDEDLKNASLQKESPYDGKETKGISSSTLNKMMVGAGIAIAAGAIVLGSYALSKDNSAEPATIEAEAIVQAPVTEEKVNPESWEKYVSDYSESNQKTFLTGEMDQITSNIVTITANKEEFRVALSPVEMTALNYYYNTFNMDNESMLQVYGDYNLDNENGEDLVNNVHDGLNKIRLSLVKAEKAENVLQMKFEDEEAQKLFDKYADLMVKYNTASKKSTVKKEIEESLRTDFIENGSIDLKEHPAATVVLQTIPSAFNLLMSPLEDDLSVLLVGTEVNVDVSGVKDTTQNNGLVDSACSVIDRRLEKFDSYREQLIRNKESDKNYNDLLSLSATTQEDYDQMYRISEWDKITADTYDITDVMIPLMDNYLEKNYDLADSLDYDAMNDAIKEAMISEIQAKQLNNKKSFNPVTNPTGGKVGDTYKTETQKNVSVTEEQIIASNPEKGSEIIEQAKQEAINKIEQTTGETVVDGTNKDQVNKVEEQIKVDVSALCKQAYEAGQAETIAAGSGAAINSGWANHAETSVRNAYNSGRANGLAVYNEVHSANNSTITPSEPSKDPIVDGEHKDNPNQNGQNNTSEPTEEVSETIKDPTAPENNNADNNNNNSNSSNENSTIGDHVNNPNQNGQNNIEPPKEETEVIPDPTVDESKKTENSNTTVNIDDTDVIPGTITTDNTGVDDMSQYGEVQSYSMSTESLDNAIPSHEQNPNQVEASQVVTDNTNEVIMDTTTTDATGVEDMSQYGEVQDFSFDSATIAAMIEEMANPDSPMNQIATEDKGLTK